MINELIAGYVCLPPHTAAKGLTVIELTLATTVRSSEAEMFVVW
jgi:hypothetical protein